MKGSLASAFYKIQGCRHILCCAEPNEYLPTQIDAWSLNTIKFYQKKVIDFKNSVQRSTGEITSEIAKEIGEMVESYYEIVTKH